MKRLAARYLSLFSYLMLLAYMMWWVIDLSGISIEHISIVLLLMVSPLLLTLRGVLYANDKGLIWSSLISLIYIIHGGLIWWTDHNLQYWGLFEFLLALIHLLSSGLYIRWYKNKENIKIQPA